MRTDCSRLWLNWGATEFGNWIKGFRDHIRLRFAANCCAAPKLGVNNSRSGAETNKPVKAD